MGFKAFFVNLDKEITIKIPAKLTEDGQEIVKVIKKGESVLKSDFAKWWDEVETEVKVLEAKLPGLTTAIPAEVSVTVDDPAKVEATPEQVPAAPLPSNPSI